MGTRGSNAGSGAVMLASKTTAGKWERPELGESTSHTTGLADVSPVERDRKHGVWYVRLPD